MKVVAVANLKGGTGKTTLAVHLATGLARLGEKTLLIDLDPQANSTAWLLGLGETRGAKGTAGVLVDGSISEEHFTAVDGYGPLNLMPANPQLSGIDHVLAGEVAGELVLRRALEAQKREWEYVVIDCPPNLGLSVLNALCASNGVVAPVLGAFLSLAGLRRLEETVEQIQSRLRLNTRVLGYVLFSADDRESVTDQTRAILRKEGKDKLCAAEIRVSTAAKVLPAHRKTSWDGGDPRGAEDYTRLLEELLRRLGRRGVKAVA